MRIGRVVDAVVLVIALVGAALVARHDAGLAGPWLPVALVATLPLYLVGRGWRLPWWLHAVAAALPVSLVLVAVAHGYADGAARSMRFAYGALLALALIGWARSPRRRLAAGIGVAALVADQYITAWFPWWGGGDPAKLMWGTFYWHNQFGIYLVIGIAVAAALAVAGRRIFALLGFLVTFLAGAGVVASGSRASLALLGVVLAVAVVIGLAAGRWKGAVRGLVLPIGVVLTAVFMTSAVFFPNTDAAGDPTSGLTGRDAEAGRSVTERIKFWGDAVRLGASSPLVGIGLQAYGRALQCVRDTSLTSHPHNEYLLAWAEGGAVAALPVLTVLVGVVWLVVISLRRPRGLEVERRISWLPSGAELREDPVRWGALLGLVVSAGHAAFDFDWAYPALLAITGLVGGLAAAPLFAERPAPKTGLAILNLGLVAVLLAAAFAGYLADPVPGEALRPLTPGMYVCPE
ncbi:O-antigen ligase family protein [Protaetiibacter sp. SSC-01]|uniref:O-antigen ligase family protein n=1 Tax=Protaetiibacter sp. SSC-01 TaxID=2759943 RepID=UPI001656C685|nr:O-antigen ligase family protein [Protaetiibacter sp. SSC-01]QNO37774.1 O-antigen ligase family protein [Protaetiibacter sp. SSC-01]